MDALKSQLETLSVTAQKEVNYDSWLFKINLMLKSKGCYTIAMGIEDRPEGEESENTVKAWVKKDLEAQALIGLNVDSNISRKISNCLTSKAMLEKLKVLYGKKSDLTIEGLQRRFFNFKYDTDLSAIENCMQLKQLAEDLEAEGEEIKESWILTRIIGVLPPKLHHFRTAWDNLSSDAKKFNNLVEKLRLEEDRLNDCSKESHNAFIAKQKRPFASVNNRQDSSSIECFKCGKKGHIKRDCKNKPCSRYLNYCKAKYPCNICNKVGHFAKDCPEKGRNEKSGHGNSTGSSGRRALITVGLSAVSIEDINKKKRLFSSLGTGLRRYSTYVFSKGLVDQLQGTEDTEDRYDWRRDQA